MEARGAVNPASELKCPLPCSILLPLQRFHDGAARAGPAVRTEGAVPRMPRSSLRSLLLLLLAAPILAGGRGTSLKEEMRFGVEAAQQGLWREAIFRWEKYLKDHPDSARLRNNLAVAYESLGDLERAEVQYKEARRLEPDNKEIRDNYAAFQELSRSLRQRRAAAPPATPGAPGASATPGASSTPGVGTPGASGAPAASQPEGSPSGPPPSGAPPAAGPQPDGTPAPTPTPGAP